MSRHLTVVPSPDSTPDGPEELWSIDDAAAYLRVPPGTLYQWRQPEGSYVHFWPRRGIVGEALKEAAAGRWDLD